VVISIRETDDRDWQAIVAINAAHVRHTSPMDLDRLRELDELSSYHKVAEVDGEVAGFLLAMREGCAYRNDNYAWFSSRYSRFLYVDRIVIDAGYSGLGIGTLLYQDIFEHARMAGIPIISCEYNLVPENHPSRIFHEKFRFREVGTQWLADGPKKVSMQVAET